jgi:hypothetical protein
VVQPGAAIEVLDDMLDGVVEELVLMLGGLEELEELIDEDDVVCPVDDGGRRESAARSSSIASANIPLAI